VDGIIAGQSKGKEAAGKATASETQEKARHPHMAGNRNKESSLLQHPALPRRGVRREGGRVVPPNRRAEWLAFRFGSFYRAAD
jgi:hypothetical protein